MKIEIELSDGRKADCFEPNALHSADKSKEICLFFDSSEIYSGFLDDIDDDYVHLKKPNLMYGVQLPLNRLVFWFYKL